MNRLSQERWEYDIADSYFLGQARYDGGSIHLGGESYKVLILPPVTTMRRETMSHIRRFFDQGGRSWAFLLRATDDQGNNLPELAWSPGKSTPGTENPAGDSKLRRWYRIAVPPSATGARLASADGRMDVFCNGAPISADGRSVFTFPSPAAGAGNILSVSLPGGRELTDTPESLLGRAPMPAGSWIKEGLPYSSDSAAYEREVEIPAGYLDKKLVMDCGQVGVAAEAWINGKPAEVRVWLPFKFDISRLVHPGKSRLRIVVTNTMEHERAVESHARHLERLKHSRLLSPVRIVPYAETEILCR